MPESSKMLPAEWEPQSAIQLTWPHAGSDWGPYMDEAVTCFVKIAETVLKFQLLVVVTDDAQKVKQCLSHCELSRVRFVKALSNDTWARDHGAITVLDDNKPILLDFGFNGWGGKYPADKDNRITQQLVNSGILSGNVGCQNLLDFILEGGSIEPDGQGTILTTPKCLLSPNRNPDHSKQEIEKLLLSYFGVERILWLNHGHLEGDDTDGHIDTLARFCTDDTIAFVKCSDPKDQHYDELALMETELKRMVQKNGQPYKLTPLPMADPMYHNGNRLPATYANFLILNGAVLIPFYGSSKDERVVKILKPIFPEREIIGINCQVLVKQGGSLHCATMQYPIGVIE